MLDIIFWEWGRAILGHHILGTPELERDLSCADQNGKADAHAKGHAIPGTSILGAHRAPEIAQEGTSKAWFNTEQLDRREAERGKAARQDGSKQQKGTIAAVQEGRGQQIRRMIVARKAIEARTLQTSERTSTEAAAQTLRVAREAALLEEKDKEKERQDWEAAAIKAIQMKWQRVGSANGEARAWHMQMVRSVKAHCRTAKAWSRMATAVKARSRGARLAAADNDRQHRQDQLRRQREPKQDRAR